MKATESIAAGRGTAPSELVLVRHAQSVGNLADESARQQGLGRLELTTRDADTPLSDVGREQAAALGEYLGRLEPDEHPDVVLTSPYERAATTAEIALGRLDHVNVLRDERLRERDLGAFDGMTGLGIREAFPEEAERRSLMGKLYYRPPGGESWTDVALRIRSVLSDIRQDYVGKRVWVFTHQAVIMSFRLVIEGLEETKLLEIDREVPLANCSLTTYRDRDGALELAGFAATDHLQEQAVSETHERPHTPHRDGIDA
ncbi:histidine phosphatase family protein [Intrasporangium calvum]|uniref:phosphoglycerate mutase (2,3-diphosphoglycerate-dependent) n=1 Tax=Intrasporangium calvum (strain ATCC 23552 / DSM 43043 / JCM 3097 / NBRC 12989 / NCIMB 10167 / NRRL B-3866 / 7 KIP) TaxID=710696 RepID=E6SA43_INTC7|nr:histidine phosphatase family protein [Intrasporangium calvum]ADU48253.1 Phosphoglycerate mutase [Intrasporangium calvum DSM 43043]